MGDGRITYDFNGEVPRIWLNGEEFGVVYLKFYYETSTDNKLAKTYFKAKICNKFGSGFLITKDLITGEEQFKVVTW